MTDAQRLLSVDDTLKALPVRKSRRWLVQFLNEHPTDFFGEPIYRLAGRDWLIYIDRLLRAMSERRSYVYFLAAGDFIKIGTSRAFTERMHKVRTDIPFQIEVLLLEEGSTKEEKALHKRFAAVRHRGEWFRRTPELLRYIDARKRLVIARGCRP